MTEKDGIVWSSDEEERLRLEELSALKIVYTPPEQSFDRITRIVSDIFDMPVALISIITADRQWFKACVGLRDELFLDRGTEREASFCQYVIAHKGPLIIPDATKDERFAGNRLVTGAPRIRFYAGAPLITKKRNILGTLCVIDAKPRSFGAEQMALLQDFAELVIDEIELREQIVRRLEVEEHLRQSEVRYKNLVELSPDMILVYQGSAFVYVNPIGRHFFDSDSSHGLDVPSFESMLHPKDRENVFAALETLMSHEEPSVIDLECTLQNAGDTPVEMLVKAAKISYNAAPAVMVIARDITEQKASERQVLEANRKLMEMSQLDGLTKIANRRRFEEVLELEWKRASRGRSPLSLIMIDIDCFKTFNDMYGHLEGDRILAEVARNIENVVHRASDLAARYGGEEFAVILPQTDEQGASLIAEKVRSRIESLSIPHERSAVQPTVTISLGVSTVIPSSQLSPRTLVETADKALYASKGKGRNRVSVFDWQHEAQ